MGGKGSGRKKIVSDNHIISLYNKEKSLRKVGKMAGLSYQRISQRLREDYGINPQDLWEKRQKIRDKELKNIYFQKPVFTIKEFMLNCRKEGIRIGGNKASRVLKECGVFSSKGKRKLLQESFEKMGKKNLKEKILKD